MPGLLMISLATMLMPAALFSRRNKDAWLDELDGIRGEALAAPDGETAAVMGQVDSLADTGLEADSSEWPDAALSAEMDRMRVLGLTGDPDDAPPPPPSVEPAPHRAYPAEMWHPDITSPPEPEPVEGSEPEELLGSADLLDDAEKPKFRFASLRAVEPLGADSHHPLQPSPAIPTPVGEPVVDIPISWSPSVPTAPAPVRSSEPVDAPAPAASSVDRLPPPAPAPVDALPPPPVPHPFAGLPYADDGSGTSTRHLPPPPAPPPPTIVLPPSALRPSPPSPPSAPEPVTAPIVEAVEQLADHLAQHGEPVAAGEALPPVISDEPFLDPIVEHHASADALDARDGHHTGPDPDEGDDDPAASHPRLPAWATPPDVPLIPEPIPGVGGSLITGPVARRGRGDGPAADRSITLPSHIAPIGASDPGEPEGPAPVRILPVDDDGTVDLGEGLLRLGPGVHSEVRLDGGRIRVELASGWCWVALGTRCDPVTVLLPGGTIALAEGSTALVSVEDDVTFAVVASGAAVLVEPSGSTVLPGGTVALAPVGAPPQVDQASPVEIAAEPLVAQNRALDAGRG